MTKNIVRKFMCLFIGMTAVLFAFLRLVWRHIDRIELNKIKQIDKFNSYYLMYEAWVELYQDNLRISDYLKKENMHKIAIYGYGNIGKIFYREIKGSEIQVSYIIDREAGSFIEEVPVFGLQDKLPEVDVIIVTIPDQMENIQRDLRKLCDYPIISLEEVVYGSSSFL